MAENVRLVEAQERLAKALEKHTKVNAITLHSFLDFQRQGQLRISQENEEKNNGAYDSRS